MPPNHLRSHNTSLGPSLVFESPCSVTNNRLESQLLCITNSREGYVSRQTKLHLQSNPRHCTRLHIFPDSPSQSLTEDLRSCGGRQLLTSHIANTNKSLATLAKYKLLATGPKCRAIRASKKQTRWLLNHRDETWRSSALWEAKVNEPREMPKKQRPEEADLYEAREEAHWVWPGDYVHCAMYACCGPAWVNVPWDWEIHAGRGVQVMSHEEVEEAEALASVVRVWPESIKLDDYGLWMHVGKAERIDMKDLEGSYIVRHANPRRRRNPKVEPVITVESRAEEPQNLDYDIDGDTDDFELVSNPDSWCLVPDHLDSNVEG